MKKHVVAMLVMCVMLAVGCSRQPKEPTVAIRVTEISLTTRISNPGYGIHSTTHYENRFTFDIMNVGGGIVKFRKLEAVWFFGKKALGAATYVLSVEDTINCHYALGDVKEPPDIKGAGVFEIPSGYANTFQLETTGDFGWPGEGERNLLITLVDDDKTYGPYTIQAPSKQ